VSRPAGPDEVRSLPKILYPPAAKVYHWIWKHTCLPLSLSAKLYQSRARATIPNCPDTGAVMSLS